jgi:hypothetical protein
MQKKPINAGMREIPFCSATVPKLYRTEPSIGAIPIVAMRRPIPPPTSPFRVERGDTAAMIVSPKAASQKYSGGPKLRLARARGGERKMRKATPMMPPKTEAMVAVTIARYASPFWAMGNPSKVVAIAEGVPGVLIRIAENEPP